MLRWEISNFCVFVEKIGRCPRDLRCVRCSIRKRENMHTFAVAVSFALD